MIQMYQTVTITWPQLDPEIELLFRSKTFSDKKSLALKQVSARERGRARRGRKKDTASERERERDEWVNFWQESKKAEQGRNKITNRIVCLKV
jgi:hypothetical protein